MKFRDKRCDCASADVVKNLQCLSSEGIDQLLPNVEGWQVVENHHLSKEYRFPDYDAGIQFVNQLARIAEEENHHPTILIDYKRIVVSIYTHAVHGLTENDFILAAKYDALKK